MPGQASGELVEVFGGVATDAYVATGFVEVFSEDALSNGRVSTGLVEVFLVPRALEVVVSVAPESADNSFAVPLLVSGVFVLATDYVASLEAGGQVFHLSGGKPSRSTDALTLSFELPAGIPPGAYTLTVYRRSGIEIIALDVALPFVVEDVVEAPVSAQGRTLEELLAAVERFRPEAYCGLRPLSAGLAAAFEEFEATGDLLREQATVGLGADIWLTLAAQGQGILRATAETDSALRVRMRSAVDQVTVVALTAAINELLVPDTCEIREWFEHSYLDVETEGGGGLWLDTERLSGGPSSFLVLVPERGWLSSGTYLDADMFLDVNFVGTSTENSLYASIVNAVNRARAAGVFWRLCLIPL